MFSQTVHLPGADALRGTGIIMVILYHMGYPVVRNGWMSISAFFTLSGFLITKTTIDAYESKGVIDTLSFWSRRIVRIQPLLLVILNLIIYSHWLPFREDDGRTFKRESVDVMYAALFATNWNLVHNNVDDYFEKFSAPSITRHLWTLAIEEQYYMFWPLFVKLVLYCARSQHGNNYLRVFLAADLAVIILSHALTVRTMHSLGASAAYYSTWCRMGDIATGGAVYACTRLHGWTSQRVYNVEFKYILNSREKLFVECFVLLGCVFMYVLPMIQVRPEKLTVLYFQGLRFTSVFFVLIPVTVSIQTRACARTWWALCSKLHTIRVFQYIGTISYGIYVVHWIVICYFGDPEGKNLPAVHALENPSAVSHYHAKNALLAIISITLGHLSFNHFEKPLMIKARGVVPRKIVLMGLSSIGLTAAFALLQSMSLAPLRTFYGTDFDRVHTTIDTRYTPILFSGDRLKDRELAYTRVLDYFTRPRAFAKSPTYSHLVSGDGNKTKLNIVFDEPVAAMVIVMCSTLAERSPCDDAGVWIHPTYWFWLQSDLLCLASLGKTNASQSIAVMNRRCADVVCIRELDTRPSGVNRTKQTAYLETLSTIADEIPGVLNNNSAQNFRSKLESVSTQVAHNNLTFSKSDARPLKILVLGDSVAEFLGSFWQDYVDVDMKEIMEAHGSAVPYLDVLNLAKSGLAVAGFMCELQVYSKNRTFCNDKALVRRTQIAVNAFAQFNADTIVVHDAVWSLFPGPLQAADSDGPSTTFEKVAVLNKMLQLVVEHGIRSLFFLTQSPMTRFFNRSKVRDIYFAEMSLLQTFVATLACSSETLAARGIAFKVVDWTRLVCPTMMNATCPREAYGFSHILPDTVHPSGKSGLWLSRRILSMVAEEHAVEKDPVARRVDSMINQLHRLAPFKGEPSKSDLLSSFHVCPEPDWVVLMAKFRATAASNT